MADIAAHAWEMDSSRESGNIDASWEAAMTAGGEWREIEQVTTLEGAAVRFEILVHAGLYIGDIWLRTAVQLI